MTACAISFGLASVFALTVNVYVLLYTAPPTDFPLFIAVIVFIPWVSTAYLLITNSPGVNIPGTVSVPLARFLAANLRAPTPRAVLPGATIPPFAQYP